MKRFASLILACSLAAVAGAAAPDAAAFQRTDRSLANVSYGHTTTSGLSAEEFAKMNGLKPTVVSGLARMQFPGASTVKPIDWVEKGAVTGIKDQGVCKCTLLVFFALLKSHSSLPQPLYRRKLLVFLGCRCHGGPAQDQGGQAHFPVGADADGL